MQDTIFLQLVFKDAEDKDIVFWFNYGKPASTTAKIKDLMNTIIENGDIFNHVPVESKSASFINITNGGYYDLT